MKNDYEIRGDVTAIIINSPKYGKIETLISTSKLERANEFLNSWCVIWCKYTKSFYVQGTITISKGKQKTDMLHRWITNAPKGMMVDHRDNDTLNSTDENMRIVTNAENQQNRKSEQINSKSGIRGVCWNKANEMWFAHIRINGKRKHLGYFPDIKDAELAVKEARANFMPYSKEASSM